MKWKTDWNLRLRMTLTLGLLAVLYIGFMGAMIFAGVHLAIIAVFALIFLGVQYFYSDKIALKTSGAKKVSRGEYPDLHETVDRLSQMADIPKPEVAVIENDVPNAFATGRSPKHSTVAVTTGLMKTLEQDELEGVVAHELAHVKNRDVAIMTIASFISTIALLIVRWGWLFGGRNRNGGGIFIAIGASIVAWIVSFFLLRALSRYREYAADRGAAQITGTPLALANALRKIEGNVQNVPQEDLREANEGMNAFYIIPIKNGVLSKLISTHPPTEDRIERLENLAGQI